MSNLIFGPKTDPASYDVYDENGAVISLNTASGEIMCIILVERASNGYLEKYVTKGAKVNNTAPIVGPSFRSSVFVSGSLQVDGYEAYVAQYDPSSKIPKVKGVALKELEEGTKHEVMGYTDRRRLRAPRSTYHVERNENGGGVRLVREDVNDRNEFNPRGPAGVSDILPIIMQIKVSHATYNDGLEVNIPLKVDLSPYELSPGDYYHVLLPVVPTTDINHCFCLYIGGEQI